MPIVIETHPDQAQLPDSELEVIEIDGCTMAELTGVLNHVGDDRLKAINELCKTHPWKRTGKGGSDPGHGVGFIVNAMGATDPNPALTAEVKTLIPVTRDQTLAALSGRCGSLNVSDTFRTSNLARFLSNAMPADRLVTLSRFHTGEKAERDLISTWLCLVEIDDPEVFEAAKDFGPAVLPGLAQAHIATARQALGLFLREDGEALAPPPFFVCFSGRKSFHCVWQFSRPASPAEIQVLKEAKQLTLRRLKELSPERLAASPESVRAFLEVDPMPVFNPIAMARIPCIVQEDGRFPQLAWTIKESSNLPMDTLMTVANARIERYGAIDRMAAYQKRIWAFTSAPTRSAKVTPEDIDAAFPGDAKRRRHGDGFAIRCPFHHDKTHSAFISDTGFIYCSVCCSEGQRFIGRVNAGGEVVKCD